METPEQINSQVQNSLDSSGSAQPAPQGQPQPQAAPVAAAQAPAASAGVPPVTATSKNPAMHSFISRVLGAFAGDPPPVYSADPSTGKLIASAPPDSSGRKIGRIVQHALVGLSAPDPGGSPSILK